MLVGGIRCELRLRAKSASLKEVPRGQRAGRAKSLRVIQSDAAIRDDAICAAYATGGYTMQEIGAHFGLHYSSVSQGCRSWPGTGSQS